MNAPASLFATRRYELERAAAALALAEAATNRLRTFLKPSTTDAVASMLLSDIEQAAKWVEWLRERLDEEAERGA